MGFLLRGVERKMTMFHVDGDYLSYFHREVLDKHRDELSNKDKLIKVCLLNDILKVIVHKPEPKKHLSDASRSPETMTIIFKPFLLPREKVDEYNITDQ